MLSSNLCHDTVKIQSVNIPLEIRLLCSSYSSIALCWKILKANIEDQNQTAHNAASDLGLHCVPLS